MRLALGVAGAVALRPDLWATAVRQLVALAPRRWWRRRPFLPVPDGDYLAFRLEAMYGSATPEAGSGDVVAYLEWCRRHRRTLR